MTFKEECVKETSDSKIKCEERKSKIIFNNSKRKPVKKIKVDDCQITEGLRCDYLVLYKNQEHFVELKGHDLHRAFKQLKSSIKDLGNNNAEKRVSYIISNYSPLSAATIQNERRKFIKDFKSKLEVKSKNLTVKLT